MNKLSLFLDSGAFSALTQGVEINIDEYIRFIKDNQDIIDVYSVLDVIGDAEGTLRNQEYMEKAGLAPIPCYHFGEDKKYLDHYASNYGYISLGGLVGGTTGVLRTWLDECWAFHLIDKNRMPKCKVHAFGMTSLPLMRRYPWYSVDSTSWVITSRMGAVIIPKCINGQWDYYADPHKITFSSKSPASDDSNDMTAFNAMPEGAQQVILEYLAFRGYVIGESDVRWERKDYQLKEGEKWFSKVQGSRRMVEKVLVEGLSNSYKMRDEMNILYFLDLEKSFPEWPWSLPEEVQPKRGLF